MVLRSPWTPLTFSTCVVSKEGHQERHTCHNEENKREVPWDMPTCNPQIETQQGENHPEDLHHDLKISHNTAFCNVIRSACVCSSGTAITPVGSLISQSMKRSSLSNPFPNRTAEAVRIRIDPALVLVPEDLLSLNRIALFVHRYHMLTRFP